MATKTVDEEVTNATAATAKLIRGETYMFKGKMFKHGEEVPVSAEIADALELLQLSSRDSRSGDMIQRPRFKVVRKDENDEGDDEGERENTQTRRRAPAIKPARRIRTS